jgi:hypothetical protein
MSGWVWLISDVNGLPHRVPEEVVAFYAARGFEVTDIDGDLDSDTEEFQAALAERQAVQEVAELKGKALDEALEGAGLSKSGSVEEKRQRLADHEAAEVTTTQADSATSQEGNE